MNVEGFWIFLKMKRAIMYLDMNLHNSGLSEMLYLFPLNQTKSEPPSHKMAGNSVSVIIGNRGPTQSHTNPESINGTLK